MRDDKPSSPKRNPCMLKAASLGTTIKTEEPWWLEGSGFIWLADIP